MRNLPVASITWALAGILAPEDFSIAEIWRPVMITVMLGCAGAPVASMTVTWVMAMEGAGVEVERKARVAAIEVVRKLAARFFMC